MSFNTHFPHLFTPLRVGPLIFPNRIMSAPTSLAELSPEEFLAPENIAYYKMRASGGASLVTIGDCIVDIGTGKSHPKQLALNDENAVPSLTLACDAIHSQGAYASVEIDHGGELSAPEFLAPGETPFGPSDFVDEWGDHIREMTREDMERIADCYAEAALRAKRCGFDMVMLHGGHGWLLHQFISPLSNKRTDEFGGSLENRARFPLMVIDRVRRAVGKNFPIEYRMSAVEFVEGGYDIETGVALAKLIDGRVDLIHVSAGTQKVPYSAVLMHPPIFSPDGPFVEYAREIKRNVSTPVVVVGALSDPKMMEEIIASGAADAVAIGRALLADPYLPLKAARGREEDITPCLRCLECEGSMHDTRTVRCAVNPEIGREAEAMAPKPPVPSRKVLIAGGGPAGMEAAVIAVGRGHQVILCEKGDHPGAALDFAGGIDFKEKIDKFSACLARRVKNSNVELRLNTEVTPELVRAEAPDVLIIAVGAQALKPPIPGLNDDNVLWGTNLDHGEIIRKKSCIVIGGGLVGCETALYLARNGVKTSIIEMRGEAAPDCSFMHRIALLEELRKAGVELHTSKRCVKVEKGRVFAEDGDGKEICYEAEEIISAMGMAPRTGAVESLAGIVPETRIIGDCAKSGKILNAMRNGYDAAMSIK